MPSVIAEAAFEERQGVFARCADLGGEAGAALPRRCSPAGEIGQRAHYATDTELVQGGQLLAMHVPPGKFK